MTQRLANNNYSDHQLDEEAHNGSSYNDQLRQTENSLWSIFSDSVINLSVLKTLPTEENISLESLNITVGANESEHIFPLAILLEESWWNVFDQRYLRHSWEWTLTLVIAYMTILIAGVIGNCMVILVVFFRPKMRTVTNIFIMNLAVADLFVIIFCVGPTLIANIFLPWILGSFMCKGVAYIQGVSVCASAYSLVAISLDRCYAVYRPLDRYQSISKSQALKTISLIWILALSLTLPWAVIFNIVISDKDGLVYCQETWEDEHHGNLYYLIANLMFCYGLPLILISVSNAVVWCHVNNRNVPQESVSTAILIERMHQRARENARKMLSMVTLTFLMSWLPLYVLVTRLKFAMDMSDAELNIIHLMMPFAQWLGSWNSSINPIIYAFLNKKFRDEFQTLLPSWFLLVRTNQMIGMGTGRWYGVHGSSRNSSTTTYRYPVSRSGSYRNSSRFRKRNNNQSTLLVWSFQKCTKPVSTRLMGNNMNSSFTVRYDTATMKAIVIKTKGTSGITTDL